MAIKAVQQFAIRDALKKEKAAKETLKAVRESGYDGIELCSFLLTKLPFAIRMMTKMAGMAIGSVGTLDWETLIKESGLKVVSMHDNLGSVEKDPDASAGLAQKFGTNNIVITGMQKFDYSDGRAVLDLTKRLNSAGKTMSERGIKFLYHNHNCELCRIGDKTAFDILTESTDPEYVNFEYDSYWIAEAGGDPLYYMNKLGERMKLYHINDRGFRAGAAHGSIYKSDSVELGYGNMPLKILAETAKKYNVEAIILESHANWINGSPVDSLRLSAKFMNENVKGE